MTDWKGREEDDISMSDGDAALCALADMPGSETGSETGKHLRRTQDYVKVLARRLRDHPRFEAQLSDAAISLLVKSAPLHDVGKGAIPAAILCKPGKLTAEEWGVMKRHAEYGRDAVTRFEHAVDESIGFLRCVLEIVYSHHEKWDGTGYPQGLAGDAIPLSARIMAVADVYDALISKRVYKPAFPHGQVMRMMVDGRGTHFDPDIADALLDVAEDFLNIGTGNSAAREGAPCAFQSPESFSPVCLTEQRRRP